MTALRWLSWTALVLAFKHVVFGAIVRISGSGMGCGEHWPKCHGDWFPPLSRPDLIIEVSHRYLAATLTAVILAGVVVAWRRRGGEGVGGAGGVLRSLVLAAMLVVAAALFGAVTVLLALANKAVIVTHLALAMSLLGTLVVAVVRAGGPPRTTRYAFPSGTSSSFERTPDHFVAGAASRSPRTTVRLAYAATVLAFATLVLGALTAHIPGANSACTGFPLCAGGILPTDPSQHLQFVHRLVAFALLFHLTAMAFASGRRREGFARLVVVALAATLLQVLVAAIMVESQLPPVWRSLHEAAGTLAWIAVCFMTYTLHVAAQPRARREAAPGRPLQPAPGGARA